MSLPLNTPDHVAQPFDLERFHMIEQQIRPWNVRDADIIDLLGRMRREDFVPAAYRTLAFADLEIPLHTAGDAVQGQCMLAPCVEARILHDLHIQPHEKVLEIGTGSGFMAAMLGQRARSVLSLEIDPALAEQAQRNLATTSTAPAPSNVQVRIADGAQGAAADGPFDVIVLSGSVASVPSALLEQLAPGGRLFAVVGSGPMMRATIITRSASDSSQLSTAQPWDTVLPRLHNFAETAQFQF